ncbi:unnamed protein product [Blepharisma stoltei]|uniref:Uncharacterized protein n=1 Tax=Blepharisma stoltei TaxID=1481888 RepID=A0AAU9KBN6_9CILI|nr:unnamed protein product [Blepharisma stoltei]
MEFCALLFEMKEVVHTQKSQKMEFLIDSQLKRKIQSLKCNSQFYARSCPISLRVAYRRCWLSLFSSESIFSLEIKFNTKSELGLVSEH